jgi:transposase
VIIFYTITVDAARRRPSAHHLVLEHLADPETIQPLQARPVRSGLRRSSGSVVTWRRAQMILLSAQGMDAARIAEVTFTSPDRVRDVIHNFNTDGFDSLYPKYRGGRPPTFTLPQRREMKKIAKSKPAEHGLPFSTWSLAKLADFLVAEGVVDDISIEGLRKILRAEGVSFQRIRTWKTSRDLDDAVKKARIEYLYAIADGEVQPEPGEPTVVFSMDEFGPLNLQPHPGRQWVEVGGRHKDPRRDPRTRRRATYTRPHGGTAPVRRLGPGPQCHVRACEETQECPVPPVCRYLRSLHPADVRIVIVCDNCPHLTTKTDTSVGDWAAASNIEIAYTPTNSSWLNRIEAQRRSRQHP